MLYGRNVIYTDAQYIDSANVVNVLQKSYMKHLTNRNDIVFLYDYYRGKQPILGRTKEIRPEICNRVVENRASEIVDWKTGYLLGSPIQYVSRSGNTDVSDSIGILNGFMMAENKESKDKEICDWMHICGVGYRLILPDSVAFVNPDECPFEIYTLDPRNTFVIYSNDVKHTPLAGVYYIVGDDNVERFSVYTPNEYFEIRGSIPGTIVDYQPNPIGMIPIIEYDLNTSRQGAFERVVPLLDAINILDSDRMDGVQQAIEQLCIAYNCQFEEGITANEIRQAGMIQLKSSGENKADFKILESKLSQTDSQTLKDDLHQSCLTIVGMPNRNGSKSTSDNGLAVIYRDGFTDAEARAQNTEMMFKKAENEMLKIVLKICETVKEIKLNLMNIECRFTRRLYDNSQTKAQVLVTMLNNDKIAPQLAFQACGMFSSPEDAYRVSMEWYQHQKEEEQKLLGQQKADGISAEDDMDNIGREYVRGYWR